MANKKLNEDLNRFNQILGYSIKEGLISERKVRRTYINEEEPEGEESEENTDFDFGDEGSPEGEETPETTDDFGTADEFSAADEIEAEESDIEEIDVTAIVTKSEEAKAAAEKAVSVSQQNSEFMKQMTDKLSNLTNQLSKMDQILSRVSKIENDIKTPEEKLELRSLDSYPFNLKLTDFWEDKAKTNPHYKITGNEEKEERFEISLDDIKNFSDVDIKKSFVPESTNKRKIK
jgi:Skp family chaperone for outer membrane proteins